MAEWPKAAVSKTAEGISPPWVRIPFSPPFLCLKSPKVLQGITLWDFFMPRRCYY